MKFIKQIEFFVLIGIIPLIGMGQEEERTLQSKHSFGLNAGVTAGFGFSYRYMTDKFGIDLTSIPVYTQKQKLFLCQGIALNFIIKQKERSSQFIYVGNGLLFSREHISDSHVTGPNQQMSYVDYILRKFLYRAGGGWGVLLKGKSKWDWTLRMGAMWYSDWNGSYGIFPSAGLAVHYNL